MLEYQRGTCFNVLGRRSSEKRLHEMGAYDVSSEGRAGPLVRWGCARGDRRGERAVQCSGQKGEHVTRPRREARALRESRWRSKEEEEEGKKWQLLQGVSTKIRRIIGAEDTGTAAQVTRSLGGHPKAWLWPESHGSHWKIQAGGEMAKSVLLYLDKAHFVTIYIIYIHEFY